MAALLRRQAKDGPYRNRRNPREQAEACATLADLKIDHYKKRTGRSWDRPVLFWVKKKTYLVLLFLGEAFSKVPSNVFALSGTGTSCLKTMSLALTSLP